MESCDPAQIQRCSLARWMTVLFIALTAIISLAWSHEKLLSQDEMYAFQTDRVSSFAELIHVQREWPISLDPLLYHSLSHAGMRAFGIAPFALRFPAFLGFLLMQACLFFFVRNMAGDRAGAVAAALPALTATLYYSTEGRPYGLLLGLYALALLCWQRATRPPERQPRRWALIGLALSIAATFNAHYFGVLLLIPLWAGEAWRTLSRRRADWPVIAALVAGMAGIAATEPFMAGAGEFKKHYYNAGTVGLHDITRAYRSIFVDYTKLDMSIQHLWMAVLTLFATALLWGCWRVWRTREVRVPTWEWTAILSLAALPFCGYLLARFVTHSIEVRYVLGGIVALSTMSALAVSPWLRRDGVFNALLVALGLGIVITGAVRVWSEKIITADKLASFVLPPEVRQALAAGPDHTLYIQDMGIFEVASYYQPDPEVKAHMALVYSPDEELRWNQHDTMALTAMHMQHFAGLNIIPYESLRQQTGEHIFVLDHSGWDWTDQAFAEDGAEVRFMGRAMGGDIVAVRFR